MKCPKCNGALEAWPWQDGGYKGVKCSACGTAWWSEAIMRKLHETIDPVIKATEDKVIEESDFPADAESDDDWRARMQASIRERLKND